VLLPLAPDLLGPTPRVRVASTLSLSFFFSAPEMAPRIVWCCQPVAAAICATVASSGRPSSSISLACLVPVRGVGLSDDATLAGLAGLAAFALTTFALVACGLALRVPAAGAWAACAGSVGA
jgi:hypothetical protein